MLPYLMEDDDGDQVDDGGREGGDERRVAGQEGALRGLVHRDDDGDAVQHDGEHRHHHHDQLQKMRCAILNYNKSSKMNSITFYG